ncbi:hypothetical protein [Meiothermus hypogaeus]|uniref:Uncharacterized protein n=1 Tax=Meiothermus hypogaeus NBRC 106114 TaxID=1227553 RepID=A0A511R0N3_9DEIN|nr:hypothetical protein [Meiothermus hypogaeus]GEM83183.1 hypothetical protein MHY01S_13490 [Meiothermus hypogaeus NBRC 106114]
MTLETRLYRTGAPQNLPWVAYQDGDGRWQALSGQGGRYAFSVRDPGGRYALAVVCTNPALQNARIQIVHATVKELSTPAVNCLFPRNSTEVRTVSGKVSHFGDADWAIVQVTGSGSVDGPEAANPGYSVEAGPGSQRLVALAQRRYGHDTNPWASRALLKNLELSDNLSLDLSFQDPATQTQPHTVTLEGAGGDAVIQDTKFHHPANVYNPDLGSGLRGASSHLYGGIPEAWQLPEDAHMAYAEAYVPGEGRGRSTTTTFKAPRDLTLVLLPHLGPVEVRPEAPAGSLARYRFTWEPYAADLYFAEVSDLATGGNRWQALVTPGWLRGAEYHTPDLSAAPGWNPAWNLSPASPRSMARLEAVRASRSVNEAVQLSALNFPGHLADGLVWQSASRVVGLGQ